MTATYIVQFKDRGKVFFRETYAGSGIESAVEEIMDAGDWTVVDVWKFDGSAWINASREVAHAVDANLSDYSQRRIDDVFYNADAFVKQCFSAAREAA